ncbi:Putative SUA5 family translation factor [Ignavibacterium album JCM 16511]|uniref:L-threonylcarbamoyladenylate synthase n=1 Tax=Ignavibacterium album (strain DSM 19864 / JCM 16511 / NBRC 101810 / Mat9-16) TaxID=945713 RepID=I0AHL8_IGNAJ|nr:L-threonylcarbamoyladenylate synthase [Ignavibacterium album]AFH48475.1 Putative SUA5 family translation factor [Ignavibacterium album JCM 16511]
MNIQIVKSINVDENFDQAIEFAIELFFNGGVFIYPTDTIYGFGGNPFNDEVIRKITKIKGRPDWKRYIHLIGSVEILTKYADIKSEKFYDFLINLWPNPVSVVLRLNEQTRDILGSETAAFRIPNNRFCLKLLNEIKMPLISTSVNRSGKEPLNDPYMIMQEFGKEVNAIFYSAKKSFFEASTVIDLSDDEPKLIREGKIKFSEIIKNFR